MIAAIIQARMGSSRLPGKVLLPFGNTLLLKYLIDRVTKSRCIDSIIVATSTNSSDDVIHEYCRKNGILCFRGSEIDVLGRYYHAALEFGVDVIVRLTADDPYKDPEIIDCVIETFLDNNVDYCSNTLEPTFPEGLDVEVFSVQVLTQAYFIAKSDYCREHVTPWIYESSNFVLKNYKGAKDRSEWRMTIDYPEDYKCLYDLSKIVDADVAYETLAKIVLEHELTDIIQPSTTRNEGFHIAKNRSN